MLLNAGSCTAAVPVQCHERRGAARAAQDRRVRGRGGEGVAGQVRGEEEEPGTLVIDEEHGEIAPVEVDYDFGSEDTPPAPGMVKTIGPNGKVEWKRYKQYTKDDILAAIEEVKNGEFNKNPF